MDRKSMLIVVVAVAVVFLLLFVGLAALFKEKSPEHFLDYSEDNYKTVFISGNLTATITRDFPRIIFQHSTDAFAPTFTIGLPCIYLYNDTNGDGLFSLWEVAYTGYMDWNHVTWNLTSVEFGEDSAAGEYAHFQMRTTLSLYEGLENQTVYEPDWANITFWFRINENTTSRDNSYGSYVVRGRTELTVNFTLEIRKHMNASGIVLEQLLQGGGSTYMFLLRETANSTFPSDYTEVSGRIDETVRGLNITHRFQMPRLAEQEVFFSKEDGTIQAYYHFSSEPMSNRSDDAASIRMNSSYYTDGDGGLILHTDYGVNNSTESIVHELSLGIVESGFVVRVHDWFWDNLQAIIVTTGVSIAVVVLLIYLLLKLKEIRLGWDAQQKKNDKPPKTQ
ncbi:MAG: hypothetical protein ACUVT7_08945 [Thermoplasmata archaeon]